MWINKLKRKKYHFMLVGLMLCFTSSILAACISFVVETESFTQGYTSYDKCPRIVALADTRYGLSYFEQFEELMSKTSRISFSDVYAFPNSFYYNGKQIKTYKNTAYCVTDKDSFMHELKLLTGDGIAPGDGELWISSVCSDAYGLAVGDIVRLNNEDRVCLKVSGIVATPICPSPYMGTIPYYTNSYTAGLLGGTLINGISFYTADPDVTSDDYQRLLPEEFTVQALSLISATSMRTSISYLADIFGGVGLLAAAVIFIVSLIIIRFIINSTLAKEYKEVGTYKALGFTENQIIGFYLKSYLFAGGAGILLGAACSFPLAQYLCSMVLRHLGSFTLTGVSIVPVILSSVLLTAALAFSVIWSLRRTRRITPVMAFSNDSLSTKRKLGKSLIRSAYSPLSTAVNDIVRKKKTSILILCVMTLAFYMSILFASVNYSVMRIGEMSDHWFAFPKYDAIVYLAGGLDIEGYLEKSPYVRNYVKANTDIELSGMRIDYDVSISEMDMLIYNDCSDGAINMPLLSGRHPVAEDEILMSYNLVQLLDINNGEWFHLENDEYSNDYLVTGQFSSMYNSGCNIIMDGEEYARFGRSDSYNSIIIFLNDATCYSMFETEIREALPGINVSQTASFVEGSINSTNSISKPLTTIFVIIFALFSVLNIVNLLIMNNIENRRRYGVLKAMGFTNGYICMENTLRVMMLTVVAAGLSLLLHLTCSQRFFFSVIHVDGLIINLQQTGVIIGILSAVVLTVTLMFSLPMRKIAPTELIEL